MEKDSYQVAGKIWQLDGDARIVSCEQYREKVDLPLAVKSAPAEPTLRVGTQRTEIMFKFLRSGLAETINKGQIRQCLSHDLASKLLTTLVKTLKKLGNIYTMATERINDALASLRKELKDMRNQDVTIMKQLIGLTNTLKTMNGSSAKSKYRRNSGSLSSRKSSMDSLLSTSNDSLHSAFSDAESSASSRGLPSATMTLPEAELTESQYHGILMTNVKLWKISQYGDETSEFSDQEEDV